MKLPLIFLEPKSNSRKYVEDFLKKGIQISPEFELGSHDLLLEFAKINLGIACVTKEFSQEYLEKGEYIRSTVRRGNSKEEYRCLLFKSVPLSRAATSL